MRGQLTRPMVARVVHKHPVHRVPVEVEKADLLVTTLAHAQPSTGLQLLGGLIQSVTLRITVLIPALPRAYKSELGQARM